MKPVALSILRIQRPEILKRFYAQVWRLWLCSFCPAVFRQYLDWLNPGGFPSQELSKLNLTDFQTELGLQVKELESVGINGLLWLASFIKVAADQGIILGDDMKDELKDFWPQWVKFWHQESKGFHEFLFRLTDQVQALDTAQPDFFHELQKRLFHLQEVLNSEWGMRSQ